MRTARVASLVRVAAEKGLAPPIENGERKQVAARLGEKEEREFAARARPVPGRRQGRGRGAGAAARAGLPGAGRRAFHQFYHQHRVVTDDVELSRARLLIARGTQQVIANGLALLGVSAPERM